MVDNIDKKKISIHTIKSTSLIVMLNFLPVTIVSVICGFVDIGIKPTDVFINFFNEGTLLMLVVTLTLSTYFNYKQKLELLSEIDPQLNNFTSDVSSFLSNTPLLISIGVLAMFFYVVIYLGYALGKSKISIACIIILQFVIFSLCIYNIHKITLEDNTDFLKYKSVDMNENKADEKESIENLNLDDIKCVEVDDKKLKL